MTYGRTKRLLSLLLLLALLSGLPSAARAADFTDLPETHWAYESVLRASEDGIVNGVGDGSFAPAREVTEAELVTMLVRAFYADEIPSGPEGADWFAPYARVAEAHGLTAGVVVPSPDTPLNRYQMAVILSNALADAGAAMPDDTEALALTAQIPDLPGDLPSYTLRAVAATYQKGILRGVDSLGRFAGENTMTRAEAAVVYCRLADEAAQAPAPSPSVSPAPVPVGPTPVPVDPIPVPVDPGLIPVPGPVPTPAPVPASLPDMPAVTDGGDFPQPGGQPQAEVPKPLVVAGNEYRLGMSEAELTALAGAPEESLPTFDGLVWYVYGSGDYAARFFMAGLYSGSVVSLCAAGSSFAYDGHRAGDTGLPRRYDGQALMLTDPNDGGILHAVQLWKNGDRGGALNDVTAVGESRVIFHLTNAFRVYHGLSPLTWSDTAAECARKHSQDMADRNYFDHFTPEGIDPADRMTEEGISWSAVGENIAVGQLDGVEAYGEWIDSPSHRGAILNDRYRYLGVGTAADALYYTQNFYA